MNYKINGKAKKFEVVEVATEQTIRIFPSKEKAKTLLRHLNLGGGFDGWTPSFVLKSIK
jgi:hypothetical protein